jgi:hypothetical protein
LFSALSPSFFFFFDTKPPIAKLQYHYNRQ